MALGGWDNLGTCLFLRDSGKKYYDPPLALGYSSIDRVQWVNEKEAKLRLYGPLPAFMELTRIEDGSTFELTYKEHGQINKYEADRVIMRFVDCQIKRRWISNPIMRYADQRELIMIYVVCECHLVIGNEN